MAILALLVGKATAQNNPPKAVPDGVVATTAQPDISGDNPVVPVDTGSIVSPPVVPPVSGLPVQALLLKQRKLQIGLYYKSVVHWQRWLGLRMSPTSAIADTNSLEGANQVLTKLKQQSHMLHQEAKRVMRQRIWLYSQDIEHMNLVMGTRPSKARVLASSGNLQMQYSRVHRIWWHKRKRYLHPPDNGAFLCIHHYEGSWTDTGAPYYGGLQMDLTFQSSYGGFLLRSKGTADHWTPLEQIWIAERAKRSRGFYPWPNTARSCHLIQ